MSNIKKKIIIGTANFSKKYGLFNKKFNCNDFKKLIKFLDNHKILYFDTALLYNSEKFLERLQFNKKKIKLITKVPLLGQKRTKIFNLLKKQLKIIKLQKFEAILLHETINLKKKEILKNINFLKDLKKAKLTKKIGLSLYNKYDYNKFRKYFKPDIIQIPLNIFDQEFLDEKILFDLKKNKIEVHARSIFLQGLLLNDKNSFDGKLKKYNSEINNYCFRNKISRLDFCINFIVRQKLLDKIVIGIDSLEQLKEIINFKKKKDFEIFKKLNISKNITKPYKWEKKIKIK